MSSFHELLDLCKPLLYAKLTGAQKKATSNVQAIFNARTHADIQQILIDHSWNISNDFSIEHCALFSQLFKTSVDGIGLHTTSLTTPIVPPEWLGIDKQASLAGTPDSHEYQACKKLLTTQLALEPSTKWNTKWNLEDSNQVKVIRYIQNYTSYSTDGGLRPFLQGITVNTLFGIKSSLAHIRKATEWPKDDYNESLVASILYHYGGENAAQRLTAADIFHNITPKMVNDKFVMATLLKLQADASQAIVEHPVSMDAVGIEMQIELFINACIPLHFQHDLRACAKHLKEWHLVWIHFNRLVTEFERANQIEECRKRYYNQTVKQPYRPTVSPIWK